VEGVEPLGPVFAETPLTLVIRETIIASEHSGVTKDGKVLSVIPFHQYMTFCLYHHEFGYYRSGASKVGREGDFYTSAYVGELMGEQLASELLKLAEQWFPDGEPVEVIDWGGGTGRLGRQMMDTWGIGNRFSLTVVEGNPAHRDIACEQLYDYIQTGRTRVVSSEIGEIIKLSDHPVIVVANELLDAFPVHRVVQRDERLWEWAVSWEEEGQCFVPCLMEPSSPLLTAWIEEEGVTLLENQTIEINLEAARWLTKLADRLEHAILVFIDYGDETEELIAPHRMDGTLLCYHQHRAHNDPYAIPGEQDLTAHVNFSHMRRVAQKAGLKEISYTNQKNFLVESGLLQKLSSHTLSDPFHPIVRRNRAIRQLLLSDGMSELFKVQIFVKD
jgi:SAM-dependent MidA family methyltransferase